MKLEYRRIKCYALAFVTEDDGTEIVAYACQIPGKPVFRVEPHTHGGPRETVPNAPMMMSFEAFDAWIRATHGEPCSVTTVAQPLKV